MESNIALLQPIQTDYPPVATIHRTGGETRLILSGTADTTTARVLMDMVQAAASTGEPVVVECHALDQLDASAVQILLEVEATVRRRGGEVKYEGLDVAVVAYLSLAGWLRERTETTA